MGIPAPDALSLTLRTPCPWQRPARAPSVPPPAVRHHAMRPLPRGAPPGAAPQSFSLPRANAAPSYILTTPWSLWLLAAAASYWKAIRGTLCVRLEAPDRSGPTVTCCSRLIMARHDMVRVRAAIGACVLRAAQNAHARSKARPRKRGRSSGPAVDRSAHPYLRAAQSHGANAETPRSTHHDD